MFIAGPASRSEVRIKETDPGAQVYISGNLGPRRPTDATDAWSLVTLDGSPRAQLEVSKPSLTLPSGVRDAQSAAQRVLQWAGAISPKRDSVDQRIVENVQAKRPGWINSQKTVGGWPALNSAAAPRDADGDGMPDAWEAARDLNPADAKDGALDRDGDGYTNLEEYLHSLVPPLN
jgi:Bacterial TSP3 repeat